MSGELFLEAAHGRSEEWQGHFFSRVATVCEAAELTVLEARAVNCCCRNLTFVEAGRLLGMEGSPKQLRGAMWHNLKRASRKLEVFVLRRQPPTSERRASTSGRLFLWDVLAVMRTFVSNPQPMAYDALGREVTARGRLVLPEDLRRVDAPPRDWLDDLCTMIQEQLKQEDREIHGEEVDNDQKVVR